MPVISLRGRSSIIPNFNNARGTTATAGSSTTATHVATSSNKDRFHWLTIHWQGISTETVTGVADTLGNVWAIAHQAVVAGAGVAVAYCMSTAGMTPSNTITATWSTAVTNKFLCLFEGTDGTHDLLSGLNAIGTVAAGTSLSTTSAADSVDTGIDHFRILAATWNTNNRATVTVFTERSDLQGGVATQGTYMASLQQLDGGPAATPVITIAASSTGRSVAVVFKKSRDLTRIFSVSQAMSRAAGW